MTGCYQLTVAGRLPSSVTTTIVARFGDGVRIRPIDGRTTLTLGAIDQPALRALLILLWDFGHVVLSVSSGAQR
jgi:cytochrome c-type biogenesis protein CcmH/NrfF